MILLYSQVLFLTEMATRKSSNVEDKNKSDKEVPNKDKKIHTCVLCKKQLARNDSLDCHLRLHSGVMPFHCLYCKREFSTNTTLTIHLRIHTGKKPYTCTI